MEGDAKDYWSSPPLPTQETASVSILRLLRHKVFISLLLRRLRWSLSRRLFPWYSPSIVTNRKIWEIITRGDRGREWGSRWPATDKIHEPEFLNNSEFLPFWWTAEGRKEDSHDGKYTDTDRPIPRQLNWSRWDSEQLIQSVQLEPETRGIDTYLPAMNNCQQWKVKILIIFHASTIPENSKLLQATNTVVLPSNSIFTINYLLAPKQLLPMPK